MHCTKSPTVACQKYAVLNPSLETASSSHGWHGHNQIFKHSLFLSIPARCSQSEEFQYLSISFLYVQRIANLHKLDELHLYDFVFLLDVFMHFTL